MKWKSINGEKKQIETILLGQHSAVTSWEKSDPKNLTISLGKIAEGTSVIINPCTFEIFKTETEIPYQMRGSSEKGIIKEIYVTVRDKDFLNRILVKPEGEEKVQIFSQDFRYVRRPSNSQLFEFDDYIFSSEMSVPSTAQGIFNSRIQSHLENLAHERSNGALGSEIYRCIKFMQEEASRL